MIRTGLIWSAVAIALMTGMVIWTSGQLPDGELIPTHWNASGVADNYAPKSEAVLTLWMLPGITAFICAILAVAPSLDPRRGNLARSSKAYLAIWLSTLALMVLVMAGVCFTMIQSTRMEEAFNSIGMVRLIVAGSAFLYIILGNYLPKTRPSWFLGIRTPWTLSSDITWEKTHRFGGRLFILAGILGVIGAFTVSGIWLALQLSVLAIAAALISVVYSYFVWRTADDRDTGTEFIV